MISQAWSPLPHQWPLIGHGPTNTAKPCQGAIDGTQLTSPLETISSPVLQG